MIRLVTTSPDPDQTSLYCSIKKERKKKQLKKTTTIKSTLFLKYKGSNIKYKYYKCGKYSVENIYFIKLIPCLLLFNTIVNLFWEKKKKL